MYYDLNVPYIENKAELQRTLNFIAELDYNVVALNHVISGKLPGEIKSAIPTPLPVTAPAALQILRRCTLLYSDTAQNYRLALLAGAYDILALRPCGADAEKALRTACDSTDVDLISLDCSQRYPFYFRPAHFAVALQRGLRIELCYAPGVAGAGGTDPAIARRNLIANATSVIRCTRGRGIVFSSEARRALELRAPADVINLAAVRGLGPERGHEAITREARAVVVTARSKRTAHHGIVDVIYGGEDRIAPKEAKKKAQPPQKQSGAPAHPAPQQSLVTGQAPKQQAGGKRAASGPLADGPDAPGDEAAGAKISNRERKRRAKRARQETILGDVAATNG